MLAPLQGEAGMRSAVGRRGSLPSPPCDAPQVRSFSLRGPARGASFAPLHLCFCSFANYALTHALLGERGGETQKTGSEHAAGFIWRISRQRCRCLGTLTEPPRSSQQLRAGSCLASDQIATGCGEEGGGAEKEAQSAKQKAPALFRRGTRCCWQPPRAPTL